MIFQRCYPRIWERCFLSGKILIIDDNEKLCKSLSRNFRLHNYDTVSAFTTAEGYACIKEEIPELIILDIMLGEDSGLELLKRIRNRGVKVPVIIMTGHATLENAITSLRYGASDYVKKPVKFAALLDTAEKYIRRTPLESVKQESCLPYPEQFVTSDPYLLNELEHVKKLAVSDIPVLITGESGTGKEIIADIIHFYSDRKEKKAEKLNCAALPETLLENELFGHNRGAYTGASDNYRGIFIRADKSTLFLDEIGDMGINVQSKILRALQNQEIRLVGKEDPVKVDVRFIAATNRDLSVLIKKGEFREDLFYRLNAGHIHITPLRERKGDIPILIDYYLKHFSRDGRNFPEFDKDTIDLLVSYSWPGNVRELKNTVQYCLAVSSEDTIRAENLPRQFSGYSENRAEGGEDLLAQAEKELIMKTLSETGFNKKRQRRSLR